MATPKQRTTIAGFFLVLLGICGIVFLGTKIEEHFLPSSKPTFGVTFIPSYAEYLGVNPEETLTAILEDLPVRHFRLSVPWDQTEPVRGQFTWAEIEWQLALLRTYHADAIVAIGRRTPRWPECHDPDWLNALTRAEQEEETLVLVKETVNHLKHRKEIIAWQVENEPLLSSFGTCTVHSKKLLKKEIALVRFLDPARPILTTESGELSTWLRTAPLVQKLGVSMYHEVWNSVLGKLVYPLPPAFYRRRVEFTRMITGTPVYISELQGEPWGEASLPELSIARQLQLFDEKDLTKMVAFAEKTHLSPVYLWGAEWWYWLKKNGHPELWNAAQKVFQ